MSSSSIDLSSSFENRRKLMKAVAQKVAEAEAAVVTSSPPHSNRDNDNHRNVNFDANVNSSARSEQTTSFVNKSDIHVSDASTSDDDGVDYLNRSYNTHNTTGSRSMNAANGRLQSPLGNRSIFSNKSGTNRSTRSNNSVEVGSDADDKEHNNALDVSGLHSEEESFENDYSSSLIFDNDNDDIEKTDEEENGIEYQVEMFPSLNHRAQPYDIDNDYANKNEINDNNDDEDNLMDIHRLPTPVTCGGSVTKNTTKDSKETRSSIAAKDKNKASSNNNSNMNTNTNTRRSLIDEIHLEKDGQKHNDNGRTKECQQRRTKPPQDKPIVEEDVEIPSYSNLKPPQDRSVRSRTSTSQYSTSRHSYSNKIRNSGNANQVHTTPGTASTPTPLQSQFMHKHEPIISPPFTMASPSSAAFTRGGTNFANSNGTGASSSTNSAKDNSSKSYYYKKTISTNSENRRTATSSTPHSEPKHRPRSVSSSSSISSKIVSPPKPKSAIKSRHKNHHYHHALFNDMKKEIEDLRCQFRILDEQAKQRRSRMKKLQQQQEQHNNKKQNIRSHSNEHSVNTKNNTTNNANTNSVKDSSSVSYLESSFEEDVQIMGQKANAMADALHRNYLRSDLLQRENDALREECEDLKHTLQEYEEEEHHHVIYNKENRFDDRIVTNNNHHSVTIPKPKVKKSSQALLRDLDSTDDYVKREYPPIPKTPGTMFATEIVDVMELKVGEHAYLAEIMDKQWKTRTDYRGL